MIHATEEYVGQLNELKSVIEEMTIDMNNSINEILTLQDKIRELESQLYGGSTK